HELIENQPRRGLISQQLSDACRIGIGSGEREDTLWAARKFLEDQAGRSPHVIVLDDAHWADSALLDLLESLTDWARDVPLLILCLARPELLDSRPTWAGGKLNSSTVALQPLREEAAKSLVEALAGSTRLSVSVRERLLSLAEGNPLFLEQMVAL